MIPSPTVPYYDLISGHLGTMMTTNMAIFTSSATVMLTAFALMLIVFSGAKMALSGAGIDWTAFISLAFKIAAVSGLLQAYRTPASWLGGQSVIQVVGNGPKYFSDQIGTKAVDDFNTTYANWQKIHPETTGSNVSSTFSFLSAPFDAVILMLVMIVMKTVVALVLVWGSVAQGVCIMIGPLFIPFLLFEKLSFLFWGWFKCFLQYSFYQLVATLVVDLICMFMIDMMTKFGLAGGIVGLIPWALMSVFAVLGIPSLVSSLFSGSSSSPTVYQAAMVARSIR